MESCNFQSGENDNKDVDVSPAPAPRNLKKAECVIPEVIVISCLIASFVGCFSLLLLSLHKYAQITVSDSNEKKGTAAINGESENLPIVGGNNEENVNKTEIKKDGSIDESDDEEEDDVRELEGRTVSAQGLQVIKNIIG